MNKRARISNIELLRIMAMFMIILGHIVLHCISECQLADAWGYLPEGGFFSRRCFSMKMLLLEFFMTLGTTGNGIFMLITGYFSISGGGLHLPDIGKISKKLISQLATATLMLMLASTVLYWLNDRYSSTLFEVYIFHQSSWYVGYYFLIIMVGRLFLNGLVEKLDRKQYEALILGLMGFAFFSWSAQLVENLASGMRVVLTGVSLYLLGGYIRRYRPFEKVRTWSIFAVIMVIYVMVAWSFYNHTMSLIAGWAEGEGSVQTLTDFPNYNILVVLLAVCLFELFCRIPVFTNRVINYLGGGTLMVYLIHDNKFFYGLWKQENWLSLLQYAPAQFFAKLALWAAGTFGAGIAAYAMYNTLMALLGKAKHLYLKP